MPIISHAAQIKMKNGQSSIEAIIIMTSMIFLFGIFLILSSRKIGEQQTAKEQEAIKDIAQVIDSEIKIALAAEDGYSRQFQIPETVFSKNVNVTINSAEKMRQAGVYTDHSEIVVRFENYMQNFEYVLAVPSKVDGTICQLNQLVKEGGKITLGCVTGG